MAATRTDILERLSRAATLLAAIAAIGAAVLAILLAIAFVKLPFPGILVEQTLVVARHDGLDWSGRDEGLDHPQRVVRIAGRPVRTPAEYRGVLADHAVGDRVTILSVLPDGQVRLVPSVRLGTFTGRDTLRYFLLPFLIGAAYLAIGIWVYRLSGDTRPGRVLAFFCFSTAIICLLLFDVTSTHTATALWTTAIALSAGAILSLAMRFPELWRPVQSRAWLLAVPYVISLVLAAWALQRLYDSATPWAYIEPWGVIYRYNAFAIAVFLGVMLHRARSGGSRLSRQQARIVLAGSAIAFLPVTIWFAAPLAGQAPAFDPTLFLPSLIVFPVALMIAIARYRILDMELIVSRTLLYGTLTAVLAGVFTVAITISQKLFMAVTGERRDAAVVLTTLIVVSVVTPIKSRIQSLLDREFREGLATNAPLRRFEDHVRVLDQVTRSDEIAREFATTAAASLDARWAVLRLRGDGEWRTIVHIGNRRGDAALAVPMECGGTREGLLLLGPRKNGRPYTQQEAEDLMAVGDSVIRSMRMAVALRRVTGLEHTSVG